MEVFYSFLKLLIITLFIKNIILMVIIMDKKNEKNKIKLTELVKLHG
ncbi:protein of unknown function [Methanocaldococcus lauensis]|nr:protein of unknown function [Methanocaldococcus lauensis]